MCRIAGFIDFNYHNDYSIETTLENMRDTMTIGGPDDAGTFIDLKNHLALGHRRLSILDLSSNGHQPMIFQNLVITYNGEVYNFYEIKKELEGLGFHFQSNSDTEVILKAYQKWGRACVHKFRGMWAFAIFDSKKQELILARDRMGVKPLYWYFKDSLFIFSSELKAFHKHPKFSKKINDLALPYFFQYSYIPEPLSIFENTHKLESGSFLILNLKNLEIKKEKYWNIQDFFLKDNSNFKKNEDEIALELENILTESFKLRMVSDVPVGMFLSGGIDSSLVTALLQKEYTKPLQTFTIGFYEKGYNEAEFAKKVASHLQTNHTELYCTQKEAYEIIPKLPIIYDEPFGDSSAIPTHLVAMLTKKTVKVSLSADGADEQFCGYPSYKHSLKLSKLLNIFPQFLLNKSHYLIPEHLNNKLDKLRYALKFKNPLEIFQIAKRIWQKDEIPFLLKNGSAQDLTKIIEGRDIFNNLMLLDLKTYLIDDILTKVDRATMGVSLEAREPFLDHKILEFSSQLPSNIKYKNGITKHILRKILHKYVPQNLIDRPKQGFMIPIELWFKKDLKKLYDYYLSEKKLQESQIFNVEFVRKLLNNYYTKNSIVYSNKLWLIFIYQQWQEING